MDATPRGDCGQGGTYSDGSDFDAETCGGFGNGDRDAAGSPCGFDAALYSGRSEGGNFDVAPYGNCNERDFDVGNSAMNYNNAGAYQHDGDVRADTGASGDYNQSGTYAAAPYGDVRGDFGNNGDYW